MQDDTGFMQKSGFAPIRLVKATSQAQALRRVARETMSCRPAHSLEVVEHMLAGVTVLDATSDNESEVAT
jgi:hypothetical protein